MKSREWVEIYTIGTGMLVLAGPTDSILFPAIWVLAVATTLILVEQRVTA